MTGVQTALAFLAAVGGWSLLCGWLALLVHRHNRWRYGPAALIPLSALYFAGVFLLARALGWTTP